MSKLTKNSDKEQYVAVEYWFIRLTSGKDNKLLLTAFQRELFWIIKGLSIKKPCYAKDEYFQDIYDMSIKHINNNINVLERLGFINITHLRNKRLMSANPFIQKGCGVMSYSKSTGKRVLITEFEIFQFEKSKYRNNKTFEDYESMCECDYCMWGYEDSDNADCKRDRDFDIPLKEDITIIKRFA